MKVTIRFNELTGKWLTETDCTKAELKAGKRNHQCISNTGMIAGEKAEALATMYNVPHNKIKWLSVYNDKGKLIHLKE
jgi:hypothetical protein